MKHCRNPFLSATVAAIFAAATTARAASFYWDNDPGSAAAQNGDGVWDASEPNWSAAAGVGSNISWLNDGPHTAFLGNAAGAGYTNPATGGTIMLGETINLTSLSMSSGQSGSYAIAGDEGSGLHFSSGGSIGNNHGTATLMIDAVISAVAGINKINAGTVVFTAANTYGGATTVTAGTLAISNATALGTPVPVAPTTTTVADNARLQLTGGVVTDPAESLVITGTGGTINAGSLHAGTGGGTWSGPLALNTAARIGATPGNTLTVTGTISNGSSANLAISGQGDSGTVIINPAGTNGYTGQTNLVRGILKLGKNNALPVTTTLDAKDAANSTDAAIVDLAGFNQTISGLLDTGVNANNVITNTAEGTTSTLTIVNTAARTYDGSIQDGDGVVALVKDGTFTQTLAGSNSYTGPTLVNVGALTITHGDALGDTSGATTIVATGTVTTGGRLSVGGGIGCGENLVLTGASEVTGGFNPTIDSIAGSNTLSGDIVLSGIGGQRINATGSLTLDGPIARDGVNSGPLVLRTGSDISSIIVNNSIDLNGSGINAQGLGTTVLNAVSTDLSSVNIAFGGPALTLRLGVEGALPPEVDLTIGTGNATAGSDQGILDLAGFPQTVRSLSAIRSAGATPSDAAQRKITNSGGQAVTFTAGNATIESNASTFDGLIEDGTGGIAFTKTGSGTITLAAANTYTGGTLVSSGVLRVNGSLAAGSAVSVAPAGTLAGTGTVAGTVTAAGTVAPGAGGAGTLTTGAITLNGELAVEINGGEADKLVSVGEIQLSGPLTVTLLTGGFTQTSYVIAEGASLSGVFSRLPGGFTVAYTGTQAILTQSAGSAAYITWINGAAFNNPPLSAAQKLPGADPDFDGTPNLLEFALNGNPVSRFSNGSIASLIQDSSAPAGNELTLVIAVRDGAVFNGGTATVDGITYIVEGSPDLAFPAAAVSSTGPAGLAPASTGLPSLEGTAWEYHVFKLDLSEGLPGKGFLRLKVVQP